MLSLRFESVSKKFDTSGGSIRALANINLSIGAGEFIAILGPSGCGKSTLLEIAAGLTLPTEGRVLVNGAPVWAPGRDRAVVFQDYALFPWRTVVGNLRYVLEVQDVPRTRWSQLCEHYLGLVDLRGFENMYPGQLSGGMQQRLAMARALIGAPKILLMDEPFASADAISRRRLQELLLRILVTTRSTVVFVTHSIEEALFLADRVAVLTSRPGRVLEVFAISPGADLAAIQRKIWDLLDPWTRNEVPQPPVKRASHPLIAWLGARVATGRHNTCA